MKEKPIRRKLPKKPERRIITTSSAKPATKVRPSLRGLVKLNKRNRKRLIRYGLLAGNLAIVVAAVVMVARHSGGNTGNFSALNTASETETSNPLDTLSSTDVAANIAIMAALPETGLILTDANTVSAELNAPVSNGDAITKPLILSSDIKTKEDVVEHIVAQGETLASLATKYGVTSDSIRWSNNLTGANLSAGVKLVIPPINGIVYTVRGGDTADSLASKFNVPKDQIIRFNDAELTGLVADQRIVIPGGTVRAAAPRRTTPYYAGFAFGNTAVYGYNGYVPGYCTWYVANKRIQIGRPLPANLGNAYTWDDLAPRAGFRVDRNPAPGDAVVTGSYRNPGHVAYVEQVLYNEDGSISGVLISEMNRRRLYEITSRVMSPAEAAGYNYIH